MALISKIMATGQSASAATQIAGDVASSLTATGTGQSDALPLSSAVNYVTTVSSGTGVILYGSTSGRPSSIGDEQTVHNYGANALNVYPPSGEQIQGVAANAAFSVPTSSKLTFKKITNTLWIASETFTPSGTAPTTRTVSDALNAVARSGDYASVTNFNSQVAALTETIGFRTLQTAQVTETTGTKILEVMPVTSGFAPFEIHYNSFTNLGAGAGTYNHATHIGYNVNRHSSTGTATANKPSLIMGMEDNYFDNVGDLHYGMEWYVEYYSPDGTSIQQRRPFYARIESQDNVADNCIVKFEVGADGTGQFIVKTDPSHTIFQVTPSSSSAQVAYLKLQSAVTGGGPQIGALGETNTPLLVSSNGNGRVDFLSGFFSQVNFRVLGTGASGRFLQVQSSATNPTLSASAGSVNIGSALQLSSLGAFAAGDKYLIADASGNVHLSALGPAS